MQLQPLTLKDAADYITKLPKEETDLAQWQVAIEALMLCSGGGQAMMARIGVMKALNRNVERVFNSDRKRHAGGSVSSKGIGRDLVHISGIKNTDSVEVMVQIKQRG
jgi:hypothetical protein